MGEPPKKPAKTSPEGGIKERSKSFVVGEPAPAQVMEIVGSMGTREGGRQVRVKVLDGRDVGKIIRRNVIGPIKIGDILMLRETEIEASPLKGRKR